MATKINTNLTPKMIRALTIANRDGAVFAGYNSHKGCIEKVAANTILALARRGLVVSFIGPDGGVAARPI